MDLSVIISERNDPVATLITARNVIEEFKACGPNFQGEVIIVDNSDNPQKRQTLQDIIPAGYVRRKQIKIFHQDFQCLFSARELGVSKSTGNYILILDSHCLMYYEAIKNFLNFAKSTDNLGIVFGPMCYSKSHESDAFCDRNIKTFIPIRKCACLPLESYKISIRSMPFMISRSLWTEIKGYSPLSTHKLCWGGGDFLIGFKPLLFGYDNWMLTTAGAVHLGPFSDRGQFAASYLNSSQNSYHRYVGMLTAAFVIGGNNLLQTRYDQLKKRNPNIDIKRMKDLAITFGSLDRRWIETKSKYNYQELTTLFKNQGDPSKRTYSLNNALPNVTGFKIEDVYEYTLNQSSSNIVQLSNFQTKGNDWRSRIAMARQKTVK